MCSNLSARVPASRHRISRPSERRRSLRLPRCSGGFEKQVRNQRRRKLDAVERVHVAQRIKQGAPSGKFDLKHLRAIHKHLFQDTYEWAGQTRIRTTSRCTRQSPRLRLAQGKWVIPTDQTSDSNIHLSRHGRASVARPGHPGFAEPSGGTACALTLGGRLKAGHDDIFVVRSIVLSLGITASSPSPCNSHPYPTRASTRPSAD